MNIRTPAPRELQPTNFEFSETNLANAHNIIKKYPINRQASAVIALLFLAQKQHQNWLPIPAIEYVGNLLAMPYIRVFEVATFYSMFNLAPVGKYHLQICGTTPCWLKGAEDIKELCYSKLGIKIGQTTPDQVFTFTEVECLGACANAPVVQINDDYYEDLTKENFAQLLDDLKNNRPVKIGSQTGRKCSEPK